MGVLEGAEMRPSYLPMLTMAGLGIAIAVYSFSYVNRKRHVGLGMKTKLSRILDDGELALAEDSVDVNGGMMSPVINLDCFRTLDVSKYTFKKHNDRIERLRFLSVVDRTLQLYPGPKLKTFTLTCCFLEDYISHFKRWMRTIARLDVEVLNLYTSCGIRFAFTFRFQFISGLQTLRELHLASCNIEPGFVGQFKSLVSLSLMWLKLTKNEMSDILLSCPNLRNLCLNCCELPMKAKISGPNLKALTLLHCFGLHELEISAVNLVHFSSDISIRVKLLFSAVPELEYLSLVANMPTPYCFDGDIRWDLPKLRTLVLKAIFPWEQLPALPPTFDMFGNVRILYLVMARNSYNCEDCPQVDLFTLIHVLSACPLLEVFHLMVDGCNSSKEREVGWPALRHKHLKHMELAGIFNTQNELEFAKFILRSAEVLQKLVLRASLIYCDGLGVCDFPENLPRCNINEIEAQRISQDLRDHALSVDATVEIR